MSPSGYGHPEAGSSQGTRSRGNLEIGAFDDVDFNVMDTSFAPKRRPFWSRAKANSTVITFALCGFINLIIITLLLVGRQTPEFECPNIEAPAPTDLPAGSTDEPTSGTPDPDIPPTPDTPTSVKFLVIGDWGWNGTLPTWEPDAKSQQVANAEAMGTVAHDFQPEFVISTGDNFYPAGLRSVDDQQFEDAFMSVYSHASLQVPWYAVLGNHDYNMHLKTGNGTTAHLVEDCVSTHLADCPSDCCFSSVWETDIRLNQRDDRWHLKRTYDMVRGDVHFFFIDTSPAVREYYNVTNLELRNEQVQPAWFDYPGAASDKAWEAQVKEIEQMLYHSTAPWKVMVGHHPVYGNCKSHGDTVELIESLEPLLDEYNVQIYLNGHNHVLEHLHKPGKVTHYITSGAGSGLNHDFEDRPDITNFQRGDNGFVSIEIIADREAKLAFWSGNSTTAGVLLHEHTITA